MALARIARGSLVEASIDHLRQMVEAGEWKVDERIPTEGELAQRLGVGRNTVREAVRVLVHAGMFETRQGDGTYVRAQVDAAETLRRVDRAALHDRLEVRLTLEVEAARLAAARHDVDDLSALHAALRARADAGGDLERRVEHDAAFHRAVVAAAHNAALADLYRYFFGAIRNTIVRTEADIDLPEPTQAEHERLLAAIEAGEGDAAAQMARQLLTPALIALAPERAHA